MGDTPALLSYASGLETRVVGIRAKRRRLDDPRRSPGIGHRVARGPRGQTGRVDDGHQPARVRPAGARLRRAHPGGRRTGERSAHRRRQRARLRAGRRRRDLRGVPGALPRRTPRCGRTGEPPGLHPFLHLPPRPAGRRGGSGQGRRTRGLRRTPRPIGQWVDEHPDEFIQAYYVDGQKQTPEYGKLAHEAQGFTEWVEVGGEAQAHSRSKPTCSTRPGSSPTPWTCPVSSTPHSPNDSPRP